MNLSRRSFLGLAALAPWPCLAGELPSPVRMAAGPLPPIAAGSPSAGLVVVEYASTTCEHCAAFHVGTFPLLYSRYIASGQVRWEIRDFPLDAVAAAGFMAARCSDLDPLSVLQGLYRVQPEWALAESPEAALKAIMKRSGLSADRFDACLSTQALIDGIRESYEAGRSLGVSSTPTFFIGDEKLVGNAPVAEFVVRIERQLVSP